MEGLSQSEDTLTLHVRRLTPLGRIDYINLISIDVFESSLTPILSTSSQYPCILLQVGPRIRAPIFVY